MKRLTSAGLIALTVAIAPTTRAQFTADYQTNIISGVTNNWMGDYLVGNTNFADVLLIQNSGVLIAPYGYLGNAAGSSNNHAVVADTGSIWSNTYITVIGYSGSGNSLVVSNGGLVHDWAGYVGISSTSSNNNVLVTDATSIWNNDGSLSVGGSGKGNSLVISNGGQVIAKQGSFVGDSSSKSNSVRVADTGIWQNDAGLNVGYGGSSNSVVVAGGSAFATTLTIGLNASTCDHWLQLDSGSVVVTNATTNAVFEIRRGKLILNGGTLQVDRFVMTNSCAQFIRTGGTLIYSSAVLTTNLDADGDGMANGWEQAYGLDPLNAADASADNDGDGFTNLQEFQAGTDPTNSSSAFRVLSLESTNTDVLVTWAAGGGRTNVVQSALDLTGSYTNVSPNIILTNAPGDVTTNYLDAGAATNGAAQFYRVRLVP
jgi:T5SS/PEP-CTERM-associated repeat protein